MCQDRNLPLRSRRICNPSPCAGLQIQRERAVMEVSEQRFSQSNPLQGIASSHRTLLAMTGRNMSEYFKSKIKNLKSKMKFGSGWESNPPRPCITPSSDFEDRGAHRDTTTPVVSITNFTQPVKRSGSWRSEVGRWKTPNLQSPISQSPISQSPNLPPPTSNLQSPNLQSPTSHLQSPISQSLISQSPISTLQLPIPS